MIDMKLISAEADVDSLIHKQCLVSPHPVILCHSHSLLRGVILFGGF